ncbi:baeRF10 domain-containing protein [Micrococcus luteus]|uniref:baeRF10 domain-containing protein n=1 Tax=Micrococcus luteus TaxID=1270 RepID=UPI0015F14F91
MYKRLVLLVEKALAARGIDRLVILGAHPEAAMVASLFSRQFHDNIVAILPNPSDGNEYRHQEASRAGPSCLEEAERRGEMELLDQIREGRGPRARGCDRRNSIRQGGRGCPTYPLRCHDMALP